MVSYSFWGLIECKLQPDGAHMLSFHVQLHVVFCRLCTWQGLNKYWRFLQGHFLSLIFSVKPFILKKFQTYKKKQQTVVKVMQWSLEILHLSWVNHYWHVVVVIKLCLTFCDPMDCTMPSFPIPHYLLEFSQVHVHWSVVPCNHLILYCPLLLLLSIFPSTRVFPVSQLFASGEQSIGASDSAKPLPVSIQGWFPLGLTGLISLQSRELSRVFSSTIVQKHQFFGTPPSLLSSSHIHTWLLGRP